MATGAPRAIYFGTTSEIAPSPHDERVVSTHARRSPNHLPSSVARTDDRAMHRSVRRPSAAHWQEPLDGPSKHAEGM
jgi:hypothetical protein